MTETAVPDDLMKVARDACRCFDEPKGCVLLDPQSCSDDCDLAFRFSRALAAERERATLAERERASQIVMAGVPTLEKHVPGNPVAPLLEALSEAILARP